MLRAGVSLSALPWSPCSLPFPLHPCPFPGRCRTECWLHGCCKPSMSLTALYLVLVSFGTLAPLYPRYRYSSFPSLAADSGGGRFLLDSRALGAGSWAQGARVPAAPLPGSHPVRRRVSTALLLGTSAGCRPCPWASPGLQVPGCPSGLRFLAQLIRQSQRDGPAPLGPPAHTSAAPRTAAAARKNNKYFRHSAAAAELYQSTSCI